MKDRPDFDVYIQLLNNLRVDDHRRFWITDPEAKEVACDKRDALAKMATEVKIAFQVSRKVLISVEEY